ncbi:nucleolar complex protein 2 [Periplaneta americana]|uniref:nucleolar complex protein 2 n=1 Tax=Periplaneta americana TaxID=6978 RepID=UPI0037E9AF83
MKVKAKEGVLRSLRKQRTKRKRTSSKNDLSTLSVDDFMSSTFNDSADSDNQSEDDTKNVDNETRAVNGDSANEGGDYSGGDNSDGMVSEDDEEDANSDDSVENTFDGYAHKKSLEKLRDTDPEFYKFLQQNDKKLLQFNVSDSEDEDEEDENEEKKEDRIHRPDHNLEVASDESDFEADDKPIDDRVVTLKMVKELQEELRNTGSLDALRRAVKIFHSALQRVAAPQDEDPEEAEFLVEGGSVFNAVVQMCVLELQPALKRCLKLPASGKEHIQLNKCKRWTKVKALLKPYFKDLIKFLDNVSSAQIQTVLLKHLHQLTIFVPYFPKQKRLLLKRLVKLWGLGEETVRVVAFLCILKITTNQQQELLERVLKTMYLTYVRNCKFMSPTTLPSVQFMRRSLAEMFALDEAASYQHVFLYVRQLAIHLRNGITIHKKETIQSVYNWQYIQSLHLWTEVLAATAQRSHLQPLLYPLIQVIIGTIKLVPTAQYYPLRFHCVQMLIQLSKQTATFIPILPFLLEVLNGFNFNKPHKKVSMKPLDFSCILRLSKSQLQENGFKDAVIEKVYQQLLEYLASESHTISFPDTVVPAVIQLKKFLKQCRSANYTRKMRQVLEKIEANARFVEAERRKVSFSLSDRKAIDAWETNLKLGGTPLAKFYESWNKMNLRVQAKRATDNDKLGEYNIPTIKKRPITKKNEGPVELFPSSDESDTEIGFTDSTPPNKKKQGTRGGNRRQNAQIAPAESADNEVDGGEDIVEDLKLSDFE